MASTPSRATSTSLVNSACSSWSLASSAMLGSSSTSSMTPSFMRDIYPPKGGPIHRSAWKANSAKFKSRIVHRTVPESLEEGLYAPPSRTSRDYMLWCCIKIRIAE